MKLQNSTLAIAIPTYNRSEILFDNLKSIIKEAKDYNIPIYISDDSSNNDTQIIISKIRSEYPLIYYYKNEQSLGHDKNCIKTISLPKEKYIWYLGDSILFIEGALEKIINIINSEEYDFISVNAIGRNLTVKTNQYTDAYNIMNDIGWHLTLTGATIYKRTSLNIDNLNINRCKNFPQLVLILNNFSDKKLFWLNDKLIVSNSKKKSYWEQKVFEVFIDDYSKTLEYIFGNNVPINRFVYHHIHKSQLFTYFNLLKLRAIGVLNRCVYRQYKDIFIRFDLPKNGFIRIINQLPFSVVKKLFVILLSLKNIIKKNL